MPHSLTLAAALLLLSMQSALTQDAAPERPEPLLQQMVEGMPRGERQEVRVLTATIKPAGRTVFHSHRFPVTVYILEGAFTLEMEGRARSR